MHVDRSAAAAWVGGSALDQGVAEVVDLVVVVDEQRVVGVPTAPMMAGRLQGDLSGANLTGRTSPMRTSPGRTSGRADIGLIRLKGTQADSETVWPNGRTTLTPPNGVYFVD